MPTRDDAYKLMTEHVKNENLQKHMLSVEVAILPELASLFDMTAQ